MGRVCGGFHESSRHAWRGATVFVIIISERKTALKRVMNIGFFMTSVRESLSFWGDGKLCVTLAVGGDFSLWERVGVCISQKSGFRPSSGLTATFPVKREKDSPKEKICIRRYILDQF